MKATITDDFPPLSSTVELHSALETVLTAMLRLMAMEPEDGCDKVSRAEAAAALGLEEDAAEMEVLALFDHWSNDIMAIAPYFGIAYKAPTWKSEPPDFMSVMTAPAELFVPPPKPPGNYYWSLDEAVWVHYVEERGDLEGPAS